MSAEIQHKFCVSKWRSSLVSFLRPRWSSWKHFKGFSGVYSAFWIDPPKVPLEAAIERWKILEATLENPSPKANLIFANTLKHTTKYEIFWESIHQGDYTRTGVWLHQRRKRGKMHSGKILFITNSAYYKPTENLTLKHFHFRSNIQKDSETFIAFCNRVLLEAEQRNFKCTAESCAAEDTAVRGQIRQETLIHGI